MATKLKSVADELEAMDANPVVKLAKLRDPFPAHQISKLPKPLAKREVMDTLPKAKCQECGGYHATSKVIHLDYVGHAALTDRLLDTDPEWSWEPVGFTAEGLPALDRNGGLWIKLTVCGVTRYGYGAADGKSGGDAMKEMIGDALRNAAMRFGAALDLWHKGDLHLDHDPETGEVHDTPKTGEPKPNGRQKLNGPYTCPTQLQKAAREFVRTLHSLGSLDEFNEWKQDAEVKAFVAQLKRDLPDWWSGGPSVPADFVPLQIEVDNIRHGLAGLAEMETN